MTYRTTAKVAERKDARRRKLLEAATAMFGAHGYHATTVPMIVEHAGTSIGNFYFYFRNKEDVFAAALQALGLRITAAINEAIAKAPADPFLHMKWAVMGLFLFLAENPEEARILIVESSGLGGRLGEVRKELLARHTNGVQAALKELAPLLPAIDPAAAAHCWTGAVFSAANYWLALPPEQRMPEQTFAEHVATFNLRAIGAPVEQASRPLH